MSKHGWTYKKLGDLMSLKAGKEISAKDLIDKPNAGYYPCYGGNGIRGYINKKSHSGFYPIIGRVGALCGNVHLAIGDFYATEHALVCNIIDNLASPYWSAYLLQSLNLRTFAKGVAQPVLSAKELSKIDVKVPPMAEQEAIVAELDEINEAIAALQQQVADLDTLAQSTFYDMFGDPVTNPKAWPVKKLGEVAHYSSKRVSAACLNPSNYVGVDNLLKDKQGKTDASFFPTDGNVTAYCIGDTLLGNIRPYLKKIWYADSNGGASGDVLVIQVNDDMKSKVHPFFIFFTLSLDAFFDFDMLHSKGAKMPRGSKPEIMKFPICNPPLSLQQEFAAKVEATESAKAELNSQIAEMQTLLASRMDYYFD